MSGLALSHVIFAAGLCSLDYDGSRGSAADRAPDSS